MTKISNSEIYVNKQPVHNDDYWIGTDSQTQDLTTKTFVASDVLAYIRSGLSPAQGGTLDFTEIVYNGELYSTPAQVCNNLNPNVVVGPYDVVLVSVNGNKYLFKLQDRTIGVLQTAVIDANFMTVAMFTSLGDGTRILKGFNVATGAQEFYAIKSTGLDVSIVSGNIVIENKAATKLGSGLNFYKGLNASTKLHEFYGLESDTLVVSQDGENIRIESPSTASVPALYVNNDYIPSYNDWLKGKTGDLYKGNGTLAKPYTNTIEYTDEDSYVITADSAIANVLEAYVGTGTRLNPQKLGQVVEIQLSSNGYIYSGDFNYAGLKLKVNSNLRSSTTGYVLDMDDSTSFDPTNASVEIEIASGVVMQIAGEGFRNSGNANAGNTYTTERVVALLGEGKIYSETADISKAIINADPSNSGNNNDGSLCFEIKCEIHAALQGVYKIGGRARVDVYGSLLSGRLDNTVSTSLKAFHQTGGQIRAFGGSLISFSGGARDNVVTFTPAATFTPVFVGQGVVFGSGGSATNLFNKTTTDAVTLEVTGSNSGYGLSITNVFESPNLWPVVFKNNTLASGIINKAKADLTAGNITSSVNFIGSNVIEFLTFHASRAQAIAAGLPVGSAFINRQTIDAGSFVIGNEYQISEVGSTSFTSIGASANTVGINFVATGVGSGTGKAYQYRRDVLI